MYFCTIIIYFIITVQDVFMIPQQEGNVEKIIKRRAIKEDDWIWGPIDRIPNAKPGSSEAFSPLPTQVPNQGNNNITNNTNNIEANKNNLEGEVEKRNDFEKDKDNEPSLQTLTPYEILNTELKFPKKNNRVIVKPTDSCPEFELPIFKTGSRISDTKCRENIWKLNALSQIQAKDTICYYDPYAAVGGRAAFPGEFPHMGAVGWSPLHEGSDYVFKCGSTLIHNRFLLTAGHCSEAPLKDNPDISDPIPKIVRLSYVNIEQKRPENIRHDAEIKKIHNHPDYQSPIKYNDVALLELVSGVSYNFYVQPACLWFKDDTTELESFATITGWGVLKEGSRNISADLQAAQVDFIESDECESLLQPWCNRNWCGLEKTQICAGVLAGGVDACQGDSGGPLQVKINLNFDTIYNLYYVVGVTSFGIGCAQPNIPGVYTRVSSFIDWIEDIVWPQKLNETL